MASSPIEEIWQPCLSIYLKVNGYLACSDGLPEAYINSSLLLQDLESLNGILAGWACFYQDSVHLLVLINYSIIIVRIIILLALRTYEYTDSMMLALARDL